MNIAWANPIDLPSRSYVCSYCGQHIASNRGYGGIASGKAGGFSSFVYICHFCDSPTYLDTKGNQWPGAVFGSKIADLPTDISSLYDEARRCTSVSSYTASILCSRKLLMNVAVSNGAEEGKNFTEYVDYLVRKGYVPPGGKDWVDHIRTKGNEANHVIALMQESDAEELLTFLEMLLRFIYEFPAIMKRKKAVL